QSRCHGVAARQDGSLPPYRAYHRAGTPGQQKNGEPALPPAPPLQERGVGRKGKVTAIRRPARVSVSPPLVTAPFTPPRTAVPAAAPHGRRSRPRAGFRRRSGRRAAGPVYAPAPGPASSGRGG